MYSMLEVIFGSVVYSEAKDYISDFLKSLEEQSFKQFHILLINDNIDENDFRKILERHSTIMDRIVVVNTQNKYKPYELRVILMAEAKKMNADLLVLGDCDDIFSPDRIMRIVEAFDKNYAFFYNVLCDWDGNSVMNNMPVAVDSFKDIGEKNFLGFSNTAINMNDITLEFINSLSNGKTSIFDWYVYSRILLNGGKGVLISECKTFYRIHSNNIAGICGDNTKDINREIGIKIDHYELLEEYDGYYKDLLYKYKEIQSNNLYMNYKNKLKHGFWWENIEIEL